MKNISLEEFHTCVLHDEYDMRDLVDEFGEELLETGSFSITRSGITFEVSVVVRKVKL